MPQPDAPSEPAASEPAASEPAASEPAASEPQRLRLESACSLMAEAHLRLKTSCDEFEALLDAPEHSAAAVRQAQTTVRAAGMRAISLTTDYLAALSRYMKDYA